MLKKEIFVRCPIDENFDFPRNFALGKIKSINEFSELAEVEFFDISGVSEYYPKPPNAEYAFSRISHSKIRIGAEVKYKGKIYKIKAHDKNNDEGVYYYYVQSQQDEIEYVKECLIVASFNEGNVWPLEQLKNYEFQNPMWFLGRSVVSRTMHIIKSSLYGFSEIAGCKISLKTHQLRTIIRCLQDGVCRYMIADEVGMGKTIEAAAVLKVFLKDHHNRRILIITPDAIVEQWRTELAYKFKILEGEDINQNEITLTGMSSLSKYEKNMVYDFIIADEVHKYLYEEEYYNILLSLSKRTENILMLSATPVQRRNTEYKKLLQLIHPLKYEYMTEEGFMKLLEAQGTIVRRTHDVLEDLDSLFDEIEESENRQTEDTKDSFDDVIDSLKKIEKLIKDDTFKVLCNKINYDKDFGIEEIQGAIAYICENYQFEKSIIRNRRNIEDSEDYNERKLEDIHYDLQTNFNNTEYNIYREIADWIEQRELTYEVFGSKYKRIISAFFSSASAFNEELSKSTLSDIPSTILALSKKWKAEEKENTTRINVYMDDPTEYESRMNNIIDYIDQEACDKKVLVFTNFEETFSVYKEVIEKYFGKEKCAFFSKKTSVDERELGAYRFETDEKCLILLSDESGGEGRNFQNADILIHIDIPWSANELEQRIGRLDRIGRSKEKPVISVVCYAGFSLEEELFKFWNDGIGLFTKSQSGIEIIMNDMDEKIIRAVCREFKYGLIGIIEEVENELSELKKVIMRERHFDIAEYKYQIINRIMDSTREMYIANEKPLFSESMMRWAALSGFRATRINDAMIRFDASSFSIKSAYNSLFIPPNLKLLINDRINQLQNKLRVMNNERMKETDVNYIQGTFDRALGLKNDYIHFFAPGDSIFDSIVNNAINSYKGTCSAFTCEAGAEWSGFIYTWTLQADEVKLLEKEVSVHIIDKYRGFMPLEQFQCAVGLYEDEEFDEESILKIYNQILNSKRSLNSKFQHLGSRSGRNSNIGIFKDVYPEERWNQIVNLGYQKSYGMVKEKIKEKLGKQLLLLKNELIKNSGASKATKDFYMQHEGSSEGELSKIIYDCFSKPRIILDSVCYVRMTDDR